MSPILTEWLTAALLVVGAGFMLLSAVGVARMPDVFTRMHAATKLPTLSMSMLFLAVAVHFGTLGILTRALLGVALFFLTMPIAAQMIGRAAYFAGVPLWPGSVIDELRARYPFPPEPETAAAATPTAREAARNVEGADATQEGHGRAGPPAD